MKSGLVEGHTGRLLCNAFLYLIYQEEKYFEECQAILSALLSAPVDNYTLGYGLTGLAWTMKQLEKLELIDLTGNLIFTESILKMKCKQMIQSGNLDYFYGATGILNYFSEKEGYTQVNDLFTLYLDKIKSAPDFSFIKKEDIGSNSGAINLGVAHGATGILLLLLKLPRNNTLYPMRESVIESLLEKLFECRKIGESISFLPNYSGRGESRLAWCYGDLPFLYCLIKARLDGIKDYSEEIEYLIERTCKRRDSMDDNLSLCHGTTIVAYLYFKIGNLIRDERCLEQFQYWKDESIKTWNRWKGLTHVFFENHSLFNGYPGFLIAMLTMENENIAPEWDSCLIL